MATKKYTDQSAKYWQEYNNLQRVKHELIAQYLGGWFPKLGSWAGRVLYLDTHAGRGAHATGRLGSPLVALKTLLTHAHRDRLLKRSEFRFIFIERDEENLEALKAEIAELGTLPRQVHIDPNSGDCFEGLQLMLEQLRENKQRMAPAFVFVDPYGFKVPGRLLRELMEAGRVETRSCVSWMSAAE